MKKIKIVCLFVCLFVCNQSKVKRQNNIDESSFKGQRNMDESCYTFSIVVVKCW